MIEDSSTEASSPQSFLEESPYSSPLQQVPHLTSHMNILTCSDTYPDTARGNGLSPYLNIKEQPSEYFRFRYLSEMAGTHGCLSGKSSQTSKTKTYPSVELKNYKGRAIIKCCLAQHDKKEDHPHQLVEEEEKDLWAEVGPEKGYLVRFEGMGIIHTAKKTVPDLLFKKYQHKFALSEHRQLKMRCDEIAKKINLNIVRLKFSAHDTKTDAEICAPVFSDPINNMKSASTNDLRICKMSLAIGKPEGNDLVFIFTEKINRKDIEIRFLDMNDEDWTANGKFMRSDVHHQYGIAFTTPPYKDRQISSNVTVLVQLRRPSDGKVSNSMEFVYQADPIFRTQSKKRKHNSYSSVGSNGSLSLSDVPETVLMYEESPINAVKVHGHFNINQSYSIPHKTMELSDALFDSTVKVENIHLQSALPIQHTSCDDKFSINSGELDKLLKVNDINDLEMIDNFKLSSDYFKLFDNPSIDEKDMLFQNSINLKPDSGRLQNVDVKPSTSELSVGSIPLNVDLKKNDNYDAYYTHQDGVEFKQLVQDICSSIKGKVPCDKIQLKNKLERLFQLRLSNGDSFLHMVISNNIIPTFTFMVKLIHSMKMSHLLNVGNHRKETILHLAIVHDMPELIPQLISKGCNPMAKDIDGNTPLHYAVKVQSCLNPLIDSVKRFGVPLDFNVTNNEGQSPLHISSLLGCRSSCARLVGAGGGAARKDARGRAPAHLAAAIAKMDALMYLLEVIPEEEIDAVNENGYTVLQTICGTASEKDPQTMQVIELLLKRKADPLKCSWGKPSAWILAQDNPKMKELILRYAPHCRAVEDIKSEPEDEYESADEMEEDSLEGVSVYGSRVVGLLSRSGGWRALALRVGAPANLAQHLRPADALLHYIREEKKDINSVMLAKMLRDIGEFEAASIILKYVDV